MFLFQNWQKVVFVVFLFAGYSVASSLFFDQGEIDKTERSLV